MDSYKVQIVWRANHILMISSVSVWSHYVGIVNSSKDFMLTD
jgi:hypothetical protein